MGLLVIILACAVASFVSYGLGLALVIVGCALVLVGV